MKIKKSNTSESRVERRLKRRRYKRKVSLREYSRATDYFDYVLESQFRRKNQFGRKNRGYHFFLLNRCSTVFSL